LQNQQNKQLIFPLIAISLVNGIVHLAPVGDWITKKRTFSDTWQLQRPVTNLAISPCIDYRSWAFFVQSKASPGLQTSMALLHKSSEAIPVSGIYRVIHAQHRLPHEVTLIAGQVFPPCGQCHEEVRFELVRELPNLARERRGNVSLYSLPSLDDDEPRE
jgi:hypothetical protein